MLNGGDTYVEIGMLGMSGVSIPVPRTVQKFGRILRGFAGMKTYIDGKSRDIAQSERVPRRISMLYERLLYLFAHASG